MGAVIEICIKYPRGELELCSLVYVNLCIICIIAWRAYVLWFLNLCYEIKLTCTGTEKNI
jgi:hypothetical protein